MRARATPGQILYVARRRDDRRGDHLHLPQERPAGSPAGVGTIAFLARRQALQAGAARAPRAVPSALTSFSAFGSISVSSIRRARSAHGRRPRFRLRRRPPRHPQQPRPRPRLRILRAHARDPTRRRILDSDLLLRAVETGIIGLVAFLAMIATVIVVARSEVRAEGPTAAPLAIIAAAAAAAFLALTALFDEWSFPHAPYVFMVLAGLLAVATGAPHGKAEQQVKQRVLRRPQIPAAREKRVPAHVSLQDVRHRGTSKAGAEHGRSGAAASDVRPA